MAQKPIRDWVYLAIISVQLFGMFVLDFTPLYPDSLYGNPSAPFHFLTIIRDTYLTVSGDPFFGDKFVGDWFHGFLWLELLVQCPLAIYIVFQLSSKSPSSGPAELAGLAFGCLTGMGTVACVSELIPMGPELVSEEHKTNLLYGTYLPFLIIPGVMAVDMYTRLLRRVSTDTKAKTQ
ncbi:hypothetical protein FSOLCH5_007371 [Fusarium solani]|uniref:Efficient mitochondria targeting-associated protein 19 n=1 Tax=Fusarium solani TaxID=169388 RepID=A0A9P9HK31_FUSSL|nr:transmembrane protein 6/97 [Fusarium solani]KAH7258413.1 transmembrane protein 6/97 [Fusarium solani]KAJ3461509.1 hypothetical protein MRS44_010062 [Fusarium solani]KAJ4212549.1 hypothetical protein NW759_011586 [Fusarium solani]